MWEERRKLLSRWIWIAVTYEGTPVIIQHVDDNTKMARVYAKSDPENELEVPVLNLIEE